MLAAQHENVYVDGGATVHSFLAEGLLSELTVSVLPIALRRGTPLFGDDPAPGPPVHLELMESRSFLSTGVVQLRYRVPMAPAVD